MKPQEFFQTRFSGPIQKRITPEGYIKGGNLDETHHARSAREDGAKKYLEILNKRECVKANKGWCRIIELPRISKGEIYQGGGTYAGHVIIGFRRFQSDVIETLFQEKKPFRMKLLKKWLENICSFELGVRLKDPSNDLAILYALGGDKEVCQFGYAPPEHDALYKKRKARGDFN